MGSRSIGLRQQIVVMCAFVLPNGSAQQGDCPAGVGVRLDFGGDELEIGGGSLPQAWILEGLGSVSCLREVRLRSLQVSEAIAQAGAVHKRVVKDLGTAGAAG